MVADAVTVEPVSTPNFPANREKNREISRIWSFNSILKADTRANSKCCHEIPYAKEQGFILEEQGTLDCTPGGEQGIWPAKSEMVAG